jgi:CHAT domain-containing protein
MRVRVRVGPAGLSLLLVFLALFFAGSGFAARSEAQEASTELGDSGEGALPAEISAARATLAQTLPPGASKDDEIRLLAAQDRAARTLGMAGTRLTILRRLVELTRGAPNEKYYLSFLWREEWRSGNQQAAFELGERLIADTSSSPPGDRAAWLAQLSGDYLDTGQPARGAAAIGDAQKLLDEYAHSANPRRLPRVTAIVRQQQAVYLMTLGRYAEAEARLRDAETNIALEIADSSTTSEGAGSLSYYQSDLSYERSIYGLHARLLTLSGRYVEAEVVVREGLQRSINERIHGAPLGEWSYRLAIIKLAQRQYDAAITAATQALTMFEAGGMSASSQHILWARGARLEAYIGEKRWGEAQGEYNGMLAASADDAVARRTFASPLTEVLLMARTGHADAGLEIIERSVSFRRRIYGEMNPRTIEARAVRAMTLQARGDVGAALSAYHEVFSVLFAEESPYVDTVARGLRGYYLPLAMDSFLDLVAGEATHGPLDAQVIADAFMATDRLRDSRVQQAMVESAARALVDGNDALSAALRAVQDSENALRTSYETLIQDDNDLNEARAAYRKQKDAGADTSQIGAHIKAIQEQANQEREQIRKQERDQSAARQNLASRFPDYHRLVSPRPVAPADVARRLQSDEAFISLYTGNEHSFTFVVTARAAAHLAVADLGVVRVTHDVEHLREAFDIAGRTVPAPFDAGAAYTLYRALLEPSAAAFEGSHSLIFATSGILGRVPMALMVRSAPADASATPDWLITRFALTHVATAAAWVSVRDRAALRPASEPFIGFGAPAFGSAAQALAPLPETRDEILAMARALHADPATSTYFDAAATRAAVLAAPLERQRVVAFSTHGLRPGDLPNLSEPALALAAGAAGGPSLLTLDDVLKLKLNAPLVVLSACNTGSSDGLSEEAVSGLGRGFFFAGSRLVLITHWEVETLSAQRLVSDFFARAAQEGVSRAEALRQAQLALARGEADPAWRHPFFWSAYALVGDAAAPH